MANANSAAPHSGSPEPTIQQLFDLTGRVALVTGATGHLGGALARALAEAGCRVAAGSRDRSRARDAAARLGGPAAGSHLAVAIDPRKMMLAGRCAATAASRTCRASEK